MKQTPLPDNVKSPGVHPQKFALWIGIASLVMFFAGLTSAYIVRKSAGNWVEFAIPLNFVISAAILLISSFTIHLAVNAFKNEKLGQYRLFLGGTAMLSLTFVASQYLGWQELSKLGIPLTLNPSGDFVYVISIFHVLHVAVGILLLLGAFVRSWVLFDNPAKFLIYRTDPNKRIRIEMLATYWHFVDAVWIYLLLFFMFS